MLSLAAAITAVLVSGRLLFRKIAVRCAFMNNAGQGSDASTSSMTHCSPGCSKCDSYP
jgi:hypothetical protein